MIFNNTLYDLCLLVGHFYVLYLIIKKYIIQMQGWMGINDKN